MKKKEAVEFFGSQTALAKAIGVTPQLVYQWGEDVPLLRACQIQVLTKGKLKANLETSSNVA